MSRPAIAPNYTPHARAERLIALGRFVLSACSLIAIYLEPSTPAQHAQTTYTLLTLYTIYALATVLLAWRSPVPDARWRLASHAIDLVLFSAFIYLTEGPASPFFPYFIFSLFCATLRFSWPGILATGIAANVIYAAMALLAAAGNLDVDWSRVVVRESYLGVITALLVYLGLYQQQLRRELASLAAWPRDVSSGVDAIVRDLLAHAAGILNARDLILAWEDSEEPWTYVATWRRGEVRLDRQPPREVSGGASRGDLRDRSFYVRGDGSALVYEPASLSLSETRDQEQLGALADRFSFRAGLAACVATETTTIYILKPDTRSVTVDDLALAHIVGRLALASFEQFFFVQQVRQTAAAEERLRISRELHDGIVQSLGGVGLQLQAIRARIPEDGEVAERLGRVQRVIEHDQRELRAIVRELRPHDARSGAVFLVDELRHISERFPLEWGLDVDMSVAPALNVSTRVAHELCRIVNEALSNAARHGEASHARVVLTRRNGSVDVLVVDNGRGFPFLGRFEMKDLLSTGQGPKTLKERVAALGGTLRIDSAPSGASVCVSIPLSGEVIA